MARTRKQAAVVPEEAKPWVRGDVVMVRLDEVRPNGWNPNQFTERARESLRHGLRTEGWFKSHAMLVWRTDETGAPRMLIIDGEHRWTEARAIGFVEGPCVFLDGLTEAEARALTVKLIERHGHSDDERLGVLLRGLPSDLLDGVSLGLDDDRLRALTSVGPLDGGGGGSGDDEEEAVVPTDELVAKWKTAAGQLWVVPSLAVPGREHRLLCGDCRDAGVVGAVFGRCSANVAFTSPPYASQRKYDRSSGFKPVHPDSYVEWFAPVQENVAQHLTENGSWFVNIKEPVLDGARHLYVKDLTLAHVRRWGWLLKDEFVWTHGGIPSRVWFNFKNQWEPIFQFCRSRNIKIRPEHVTHSSDAVPQRGGPALCDVQGTGQGGVGDVAPGMAYPGNVLSVGKARESLGHEAAFPVGLPAFFVRAYTDVGDVVYDPFLGSGTTMVATEKHGRVCVGCELSPKYVAVTLERLSRLGLTPRLEGGAPARRGTPARAARAKPAARARTRA